MVGINTVAAGLGQMGPLGAGDGHQRGWSGLNL